MHFCFFVFCKKRNAANCPSGIHDHACSQLCLVNEKFTLNGVLRRKKSCFENKCGNLWRFSFGTTKTKRQVFDKVFGTLKREIYSKRTSIFSLVAENSYPLNCVAFFFSYKKNPKIRKLIACCPD